MNSRDVKSFSILSLHTNNASSELKELFKGHMKNPSGFDGADTLWQVVVVVAQSNDDL